MVKLRIDGINEEAAKYPELLKTGIDSILTAIDNSLSGYNPSSLLTRFNAGETIMPDTLFTEMYRLSRLFYEFTDGAFDVAAGPLFDAWGFGFKDGELPSDEEVEGLLSNCGMGRLRGDMSEAIGEDGMLRPSDLLADNIGKNSGTEWHSPNGATPDTQTTLPQLNFNAIAQGYSCDLVADWLRGKGVTDFLIMLGGGEICCEGLNPSGKAWTIGIDSPIDGNYVSGANLEGTLTMGENLCGIATSGNYRKFYVRDGKKYAHTIDPRTGHPVEHNLLSATIIAEDTTTADALATYCMVIGYEASKEFIQATGGIEGYLIYDNDTEGFGVWQSEGITSNQ